MADRDNGDVALTTVVDAPRESRERGASMVVIGSPWAVEVARQLTIPILAVPAHLSEPPRQGLLAIDFSTCSVHAASVALRVMARPARALMVSVGTEPTPHVQLLLDTIEDTLGRPGDVAMTRQCVEGETGDTLLRLAAKHTVDLISVGRCGRSSATCAKPGGIGHVARTILSNATCSVLLVASPDAVS